MDQNDFNFQRIAQGYKDRPFLHKQVIEGFQRKVTDRRFDKGRIVIESFEDDLQSCNGSGYFR